MRSLYGLRNIAQSLEVGSREVLSRMGGTTGQRLLSAMGPQRRDWYQITNQADDGRAQLFLYDEIGWFGTTAQDFVDELNSLDVTELDVHINSIGGSVFDGVAIFNALRTHDARVTTQVDSAALSIASVIAQAGDHRIMVSASQMMIHDAWGLAIGGADDMREYADLLDRQTDNIAAIYSERAGGSGSKKHFRSLMKRETWLNAGEAVEEGLADEVLVPKPKDADTENKVTPGLEDEGQADDWLDQFVSTAESIY